MWWLFCEISFMKTVNDMNFYIFLIQGQDPDPGFCWGEKLGVWGPRCPGNSPYIYFVLIEATYSMHVTNTKDDKK